MDDGKENEAGGLSHSTHKNFFGNFDRLARIRQGTSASRSANQMEEASNMHSRHFHSPPELGELELGFLSTLLSKIEFSPSCSGVRYGFVTSCSIYLIISISSDWIDFATFAVRIKMQVVHSI